MQVYHNFFTEHEGLKGKIPARACGIEFDGENKWQTSIENASFNKTEKLNEKLEDFGKQT
jgi:hypothetical protein